MGDVLVYAKVRNPEAKEQLKHLLENLPGERIGAALYEVSIADWDEGLWEEEIERMLAIIDPATDTLVLWSAIDGQLARTCLAGRFV